MKVLVVFDHPRRGSFSGALLDAFLEGLAEAGHEAEVADLYAEGFDPRMPLADEPDWDDDDKVYSEAVLAEQARIERNDAIAFLFPVWWWSLPAMTKGWIDRVWNNGWSYGARKLALDKALLIGVAANSEDGYRKRGYDEAMRVQLLVGIMNYCGIEKADLALLYDALETDQIREDMIAEARRLGRVF
jgi:NAD(P)H dehydrogenase (quinone)